MPAGDTVSAAANSSSASLSYGLDEIAKLAKSGADESLILAYVQSSPIAYRATADDIIQLRGEGVSSAVLGAVMRHGSELRERNAQTQAAAPQTAVAAAPAPAVSYAAPVADQPPSVSVVYIPSYPSYTYSYGWYGYGGYYAYPFYSRCYYPRFNTCYPRFNSCAFPARSACFASHPTVHGAFAPRFSSGATFGGGHRGGFMAGGFHRR